MTEIESRDVDFLEEDFPSISEVKRNLKLYELQDPQGGASITVDDIDEPATYEEAMTSLNANEWITAMKEEMSSMTKNSVWELVDLPTGCKTIGNKWFLKVKHKADGSIDKFKAWLVAKGYSHKEVIDYEETFSPVVRFASVRLILVIVAHLDLELFQMDVKTAFLNGELDEEIYMDPEGNNMEMIVATQKWLSSTFEIKDKGEAEYILGVKIH
ncbi:UNVERIFIED_CONTAM: Retrovirus-related Pol polyprotein from transposon TNT 1-94 [Sesamum calycinum]|uniref:Retrovirus-related Pol polyprotein from transposon TNT 1-94 n=1 Tax=Sesamum calycinum TaxID=2727403 RepID=A0AAW2SVW2_9LAMI